MRATSGRMARDPMTGDEVVAHVGCPLMAHDAHDEMPCEYCGMTYASIAVAAEETESIGFDESRGA